METIGRVMIMAGLFAGAICHILIAVTALRDRVIKGLLCMLIPGYVFYYAWRGRSKINLLKILMASLLITIVGAAALSF